MCEFTVGDCVGELEFIYDHRTVADVRAKTAEVRSAKLHRAHFEMCMGPIVDLLKSHAGEDNKTYDYYNKSAKPQVTQGCIGREGASEASPEAVRQAVGGGCHSGWGRLLSVTKAVELGVRETVARHRLGALKGIGGYSAPLAVHSRQVLWFLYDSRFSAFA